MTDKIKRAKIGIVYNHPFFATLLLRKKFIADPSIKTAVTNGPVIRYNPEFFNSLSMDELQGVICKQIAHTGLLHPFRRNGREMNRWKKACDIAAANFIASGGLVLPADLTNPGFDNMSAESIYKVLPEGDDNDQDGQGDGEAQMGFGAGSGQGDSGDEGDDQQNDSGQGKNDKNNDPNGCGTFEDAPIENRKELEDQAKQETAQAMMIGKQQGNMPGNQDLLYEILNPQVPWREVLSRFIVDVSKNDYSFSRPNTRYAAQGVILPSLYSTEIGKIAFIVDTSASLNEEDLSKVFTELHDVAETFDAHITVVYVDTEVQGHADIEPFDDLKLDPVGGGGTDFRPGFKWLEENGIDAKCIIYLTDGQCDDFPDQEPDIPVLWAITGSADFEPPFGEIVKID